MQRQRISEKSFWSYCCAQSGTVGAVAKLTNAVHCAIFMKRIIVLQGTRENNSRKAEGQTGWPGISQRSLAERCAERHAVVIGFCRKSQHGGRTNSNAFQRRRAAQSLHSRGRVVARGSRSGSGRSDFSNRTPAS